MEEENQRNLGLLTKSRSMPLKTSSDGAAGRSAIPSFGDRAKVIAAGMGIYFCLCGRAAFWGRFSPYWSMRNIPHISAAVRLKSGLPGGDHRLMRPGKSGLMDTG